MTGFMTRAGFVVTRALLCLLLLVPAACGGRRGTEPHARPWNVLLVTFDTTRADRIGCYGNERIDTPTLDGLARDGIRFARTLSAVPITAPSHSTILTGRYPIAHGVRDNGLFTLDQDQLTLAEILGSHGYESAAAIGAYPLTARFGLDQGFDLYDDHLTGIYENYSGQRVVPKERLFFDERRAAQVNEAILPWLEERSQDPDSKPFFAWVHYFDPHQPFEPPPPYAGLYADDLYDGEIAYADSRLGFLLDYLDKLGELDRTLIVMAADHGEGLGEHNEVTHAVLAYNSTLHVPLIIRPPGEVPARGTVVNSWVGTVDIVPTILDLLGFEVPDTVQGRSLVPLWSNEESPAGWDSHYYAENLSPRLTHGWGELRIVLDGRMKYIHGPEPELFDLETDPGEQHDLAHDRPDETEAMRNDLEGLLDRLSIAGVSSTDAVDPEVRRRLEALGYLQSTAATAEQVIVERLRSDGVTPRRRVGDINDVSAAKHLLFAGRSADALNYTRKLLRRAPDNPYYVELCVTALLGSGHIEEAWEVAGGKVSDGSLSEPLMLSLTSAEFERGDRRSALAVLQRHFDIHPSAQGAWRLASFHKRLGEFEQTRSALENALELDPGFTPARIDFAIWLAQAGDEATAESEFLRAIADNPYYPEALYNYGTFLLHDARYADAAAYFHRAISLAPRYLEAHVALVAAYVGGGENAQAEEALQSLRRLAPSSQAVINAEEILTVSQEPRRSP